MLAFNAICMQCTSELLKSGVVSANAMVDKHSPSSALVRVCENGLYKFAKTLIEYGAEVRLVSSVCTQ